MGRTLLTDSAGRRCPDCSVSTQETYYLTVRHVKKLRPRCEKLTTLRSLRITLPSHKRCVKHRLRTSHKKMRVVTSFTAGVCDATLVRPQNCACFCLRAVSQTASRNASHPPTGCCGMTMVPPTGSGVPPASGAVPCRKLSCQAPLQPLVRKLSDARIAGIPGRIGTIILFPMPPVWAML